MSKYSISIEHRALLTVKEASTLFNIPEKYIYLDAYKNRNRKYLIWNNNEPLIKRKYFDIDIYNTDIDNFRWDIKNHFFILDCFSDILFSDNYYIYFITDGEFVKIGYASNIKERICALQIGNPRRLKCLFSIGVKDEKSALLLETFLHNIYKDMHQLGEL